MHIHDDHLYHGAALIQVAEHPQFTAINSLKNKGAIVPVAYKVNDEIALYLKYSTKPTPSFKEYTFTFNKDHLQELSQIRATNAKTFIALICVKDREICCITYEQLVSLIDLRKADKGASEDQYVILVTAEKNKKLRVYVNAAGRRKTFLGEKLLVSRNAFPEALFG